MDLSIVIITLNEDRTIGACIESVLGDTSGLHREVILVDASSTDRTVEIARRYPVTVIRIDECSEFSPAAGRHVGTRCAKGKYILFLDGDNILIPGWVGTALAQFKAEPIAAIAGRIYRVNPGEEQSFRHPDRLAPGAALYLPTAGMYKRDVLEQVGSFNPFLKGEEERELGFRIRMAGHSIRQVNFPMIYHMLKERTRSELDEKAGYYTGVGQIFRRYGPRSISWNLLIRHRMTFAVHVTITATCFWLIGVTVAEMYLHTLATVVVVALLILAMAALKGWLKLWLFFRNEYLVLTSIIRGFWRGLPEATKFREATTALPSRVCVSSNSMKGNP